MGGALAMAAKRIYPDTPLGRARAHRDLQNGRLSDAGHVMRWRKVYPATEWVGYRGTCQGCRGEVDCSQYGPQWRSASSPTLLKWMGINVIKRCSGRR